MNDRWDVWEEFKKKEGINGKSDVKVTQQMLDETNKKLSETLRENQSFRALSVLKASEFYVSK